MLYSIISLLFFIGVAFHVMQKISSLKKEFDGKFSIKEVFVTFFEEEWDSLIVSVLVYAVMAIALYLIKHNDIVLPAWIDSWGIYSFSLVLGYSGQRIAYQYLATAETELNKRLSKMAPPTDEDTK